MADARVLFCCWGDCQQTIAFCDVRPEFCPHCRRKAKWIEIRGVVGERVYELNVMDRKFLKSLRIAPE
jgi:hypothetical protein